MRRAVARGRVFPQGYSTDRRYGRLVLKSVALFPLMWANADDQGRLCGDPEEVKYTCCPNMDHITKTDIPELLKELESNQLVKVYQTPQSPAVQFLDWWHPILGHRPQWAYPSQYPPPNGWIDRLRYHPTPTEIITENWIPPGQFDRALHSTLRNTPKGGLPRKLRSRNKNLSQTLSNEKEYEEGIRKREEEEGSIPSKLGSTLPSNPHPRHLVLSEQDKEIYEILKENYRMRWGHVHADNRDKITPRQLKAKDEAQLRDLAIELSDAGGCSADKIKEAFDEAAGAQKHSVWYVRGILFDWLGIERKRST